MRLPNGYGSITKLSGNRRKPYMVRITAGWTDEGKQIMQPLGYYAKRAEALAALAAYNNNPYNPIDRQATFKEIYQRFCQEKYFDKNLKIPNPRSAAYSWCKPIFDFPFVSLRAASMQKIVNDCPRGWQTKKEYKNII